MPRRSASESNNGSPITRASLSMNGPTPMDSSIPASRCASGGPVSGTRKMLASVATRVSSGSSPTSRAKAAPEVAAAPVAMITTPAAMPGSSGSSDTMPAATKGETSSSTATIKATRMGRRRWPNAAGRSTRSSTKVTSATTLGVMNQANSRASQGEATPPKMPKPSSAEPCRADHGRTRIRRLVMFVTRSIPLPSQSGPPP